MFSWPSGWQEVGAMENGHGLEQYLLPEQGRKWLYLQPLQGGYYQCHMWDWATRAGSGSNGSFMEPQWEKYKVIPDKITSKQVARLTLNEEWWSFISLTLSRGRREKKKGKLPPNPSIYLPVLKCHLKRKLILLPFRKFRYVLSWPLNVVWLKPQKRWFVPLTYCSTSGRWQEGWN